jgi:hypothetical protein
MDGEATTTKCMENSRELGQSICYTLLARTNDDPNFFTEWKKKQKQCGNALQYAHYTTAVMRTIIITSGVIVSVASSSYL